jgi:hypothetical protein
VTFLIAAQIVYAAATLAGPLKCIVEALCRKCLYIARVELACALTSLHTIPVRNPTAA